MAARPQYSYFALMKTLFHSFLLLFLFACFLEKTEASEIQFHDHDISSHLSSASVCNRVAATGFRNRESALEVVHSYSPCARTDKNRPVKLPSLAKILANDQLRVKSIQARTKPDSITKSRLDKKAKLPAGSGVPLHTLNYIVNIGLGTPERRLSLEFATGDDLTWTQCQPCACYQQKDKIFDPRQSTSYSNISCSDKKCSQLRSATSSSPGCSSGTCVYTIEYGDRSFTIGYFAKDKLTVTPTDVFQNFLFGCAHNTTGLFGQVDGILGLGRNPVSFVSQTTKYYGGYFSYCLPLTIHSSGFLAFGKNNKTTKNDDEATMIFTPFVPPPPGAPPSLYYIEITTISIAGKRLAINEPVFKMAGAIIDSGTVITRLPPAAYNAVTKEFKKNMKELNHTRAPAFQILDTCFYNITKVPTMSFTFKGNARVDLDPSGILYTINSTYACLAFAGNSEPSELAVFGNNQQKKFEVAYDVAGGKIGFAHNPNCQ